MKVSLIVPTRNRVPYLERLIRNIESQSEIPDEVIFVFHKDDLKTKQFLQNFNTNLTLNLFETNGGTCRGRNVGINSSNGEILIFIEDDVILDDKYIENVKKLFRDTSINVIAGYTFDIVDLTTPWLIKKSEIEYILENGNNKFFQMIINERSKLGYVNPNRLKFIFYHIFRKFRNFFKLLILQEGIKKGKILSSGYRSEMPDIKDIKRLQKVEWINGGNFAARRKVFNKFKFNESMENLPYVLGEDLEFSARMGKDFDIIMNPEIKLFHLRAPSGVRIDQRQKFKAMVTNFYRIAKLKGNMAGYSWSIFGLLVSRIFILPFHFNTAKNEIKGILDGINELRKINV